MMTVKNLLESQVESSPDGKYWEPALPSQLWWRIRLGDAWAVWTGKAIAVRQTTKEDLRNHLGVKND